MATPRTLSIPPQIDERGGARLTALASQGQQAIEQGLVQELVGDGQTKHPWLQGGPSMRAALFADDSRARREIEAHVRSVFARYEALELAGLLGITIGARPSGDGKRMVEIAWKNLRKTGDQQPQITRVEMG